MHETIPLLFKLMIFDAGSRKHSIVLPPFWANDSMWDFEKRIRGLWSIEEYLNLEMIPCSNVGKWDDSKWRVVIGVKENLNASVLEAIRAEKDESRFKAELRNLDKEVRELIEMAAEIIWEDDITASSYDLEEILGECDRIIEDPYFIKNLNMRLSVISNDDLKDRISVYNDALDRFLEEHPGNKVHFYIDNDEETIQKAVFKKSIVEKIRSLTEDCDTLPEKGETVYNWIGEIEEIANDKCFIGNLRIKDERWIGIDIKKLFSFGDPALTADEMNGYYIVPLVLEGKDFTDREGNECFYIEDYWEQYSYIERLAFCIRKGQDQTYSICPVIYVDNDRGPVFTEYKSIDIEESYIRGNIVYLWKRRHEGMIGWIRAGGQQCELNEIYDEKYRIAGNEINVETMDKGEDIEMSDMENRTVSDEEIINTMEACAREFELYYDRKDLINFHTSVKSSNLTILSGLSGSGKSKIVEVYAKALGISPVNKDDKREDRLKFIPVRPSWNDDSDLLGYVDINHMVYRSSDIGFVDFLKNAGKNPDKLYLVCFDEMNLARVEHYFSQFLSLLERPEDDRRLQLYDKQYENRLYNAGDFPYTIDIPTNIRFIGTVNVDESTYHFSDKVLDRANVIKLDILNYSTDWENDNSDDFASLDISCDDYNKLIREYEKNERLRSLLYDIHKVISNASEKYGVGPRIVKAIEKYLANLPDDKSELDSAEAIDIQLCQRVFTKLRGPENLLKDVIYESGDNSLFKILGREEYEDLSSFERSKRMLKQKGTELKNYGYCM